MQVTRQSYFKTYCPEFDCEVSHDLSHKSWEMADSAGLLDSDVYEVQDTWTGQKELHATNHAAKVPQNMYTTLGLYHQLNNPRLWS